MQKNSSIGVPPHAHQAMKINTPNQEKTIVLIGDIRAGTIRGNRNSHGQNPNGIRAPTTVFVDDGYRTVGHFR